MLAETFYKQILHISDDKLVRLLADITEYRSLQKGELLIGQGDKLDKFVFLIDGILRGFFLDINGRDITDCFMHERGAAVLFCMTTKEGPSPVGVEALTACNLLCVRSDAMEALMREEPELVWMYSVFLQNILQAHWKIKTILCQCTAMERYQWFLNAYPGLIDRISNKHIASYLGITPVTLSRLRRELREKPED